MKNIKLIIVLLGFFVVSCTNRDGEIIDLINTVKKQNEDLKGQITALKKTTDSALVAVLKVSSLQATTDKKIDLIQTDLKSLLTQIASLTSQMTVANADLAALKIKIDALQVKCAELVAQIVDLNYSIIGYLLDIDGNKYNSVTIGTQVWLDKNLNVTKFNNGDVIPESKNYTDWLNNFNQEKPTFCYFNFDSKNKNLGILYNWYSIKDPRLLAPKGYRLPTYEDFEKLIILNGGLTKAGGSLKSFNSWNSPNIINNDRTEFNAIAGGYMDDIGRFNFINERVSFWTISEAGPRYAKGIGMINNATEINNGIVPKIGGLYLRVLKE